MDNFTCRVAFMSWREALEVNYTGYTIQKWHVIYMKIFVSFCSPRLCKNHFCNPKNDWVVAKNTKVLHFQFRGFFLKFFLILPHFLLENITFFCLILGWMTCSLSPKQDFNSNLHLGGKKHFSIFQVFSDFNPQGTF